MASSNHGRCAPSAERPQRARATSPTWFPERDEQRAPASCVRRVSRTARKRAVTIGKSDRSFEAMARLAGVLPTHSNLGVGALVGTIETGALPQRCPLARRQRPGGLR